MNNEYVTRAEWLQTGYDKSGAVKQWWMESINQPREN